MAKTPIKNEPQTKPATQKARVPKYVQAIEVYHIGSGRNRKKTATFKHLSSKETKAINSKTTISNLAEYAAYIFKTNKWPVLSYAISPKGYIFTTTKKDSIKNLQKTI